MAYLLRVPEVATGATEAVLTEWLVQERGAVSAAQSLVVLETDKASIEVPVGEDAVLLRRLAQDGDTVEVGSPMALIGDAAEADRTSTPCSPSSARAAPPRLRIPRRVGAATPGGTAPRMGEVSAAPEPETAPEPGVQQPASTAPADVPAPAPVPGPTTGGGPPARGGTGPTRIFASPVARRILAAAGVDPAGVEGTGPSGRIVRLDAERAVRAAQEPPRRSGRGGPGVQASQACPGSASVVATAPPAPTAAATPTAAAAGYEDVPHSRLRRAIATRLTASKTQVPHFYLKRSAAVDDLLDLRRRLNDVSAQKISVNDLVLRAVALAHVAVPEVNAVWREEAVRRFTSVDVAVAVASSRGLVTPVLRDVQGATPSAVAREVRRLVALADSGKLSQHDLEGGSITVTNLGMHGFEEFSAIINPPQSAILAVGAARPVPAVRDGAVEVVTSMSLVLSADHRVIDGALAAQWMGVLVGLLERPMALVA